MKSLSLVSRVTFAAITVLGLLVYVVVVDLGVNAGRVHRGVAVKSLAVGGLTPAEAVSKLREAANEMKSEPITFESKVPGVGPYEFFPSQLGWRTRPTLAAAAAYGVGRTAGLWRSVEERARAWLGGVEVGWFGSLSPELVDPALDELAGAALDEGYRLKRTKMIRRIRNAITDWPDRKPTYAIPVVRI